MATRVKDSHGEWHEFGDGTEFETEDLVNNLEVKDAGNSVYQVFAAGQWVTARRDDY